MLLARSKVGSSAGGIEDEDTKSIKSILSLPASPLSQGVAGGTHGWPSPQLSLNIVQLAPVGKNNSSTSPKLIGIE